MNTTPFVIQPPGVNPYPMHSGNGAWKGLSSFIPQGTASAVLISDENVDGLYGDKVARILERVVPVERICFPPGEASKSRRWKARIEDAMLQQGLGRDSLVVALGGGVTMDIAGFVAATYMRGIPLILLPTSLLAMVDAAIGGKTGVITGYGKNLIGAFHHPAAVLSDLSSLSTLPEEELLNGWAETAKAGIVGNKALFLDMSEAGFCHPLPQDRAADLISRAASVKITIVEHDPQEKGLRNVLNFGHTVGHAFEKVSGFSMGHGRAVAAGMHIETELAKQTNVLNSKECAVIRDGLSKMGLHLEIPAGTDCASVVEALTWDKKKRSGEVRFALPESLGTMSPGPDGSYTVPVDRETVKSVLEEAMA